LRSIHWLAPFKFFLNAQTIFIFRPTLQHISGHEFLAEHSRPVCIPPEATHAAPEWSINAFGEIVAVHNASTDKYVVSKPNKVPRGSQRRPLGQRDPNVEVASCGHIRPKNETSNRDVLDVQGMVHGAVTNNFRPPAVSASPFQIYDETESRTPSVQTISRGSFSLRPSPSNADELVIKTNALSLRAISGGAPKPSEISDFGRAQSVVSGFSSVVNSNVGASVVNAEGDTNILHQMLDNLENVMMVTDSRKGTYHAPSPRAVHRGGPNKWVARYVDYTSKYGLGFLLNDGR
jgi:hypothetical protein